MASLEQPLERNRRVPLNDRAMDDYQIAGVGLVERERLQMRSDCREIETDRQTLESGTDITKGKRGRKLDGQFLFHTIANKRLREDGPVHLANIGFIVNFSPLKIKKRQNQGG